MRANEFDVPHPIEFDDDLWMIEMTIVSRPFIVDFAGATLDRRGVRFDDLDVVDERLPNEQDEFESD